MCQSRWPLGLGCEKKEPAVRPAPIGPWPAPRLAPPYRISVALDKKATACFGCKFTLSKLLDGPAVDGDANGRLDEVCGALNIVAYVVAVFFGGEPRHSELAAVDAQAGDVPSIRRLPLASDAS